ncbi:MAG: AMIN domain-containing protein [Gemmatimonadota bacterium]
MTAFLTALAVSVFGGDLVKSLDVLPNAERTEIVIGIEGEVQYRDFTLEAPARLVVDLLGARHGLPQANYFDINRGGVKAVRTSQYSEDVVRVVVELDQAVTYDVQAGSGFVRVSLQGQTGTFEPWSTVAEAVPMASGPAPAEPDAVADLIATREARLDVQPLQQEARRITVAFAETPIRDVLFTFAEFAGRSIVAGTNVQTNISADIRDQPWDIALQTILEAQGLAARELETGIIRVDNIENLSQRETIEALQTRPFRVNYAAADELSTSIQGLLSDRGKVTVGSGTNTVIVTDVPRVLEAVEDLIGELDVRTPMVNISAKIIFVNRTDLNEFGITYDLKDSRGNQLNVLTPGAIDENGDGVLSLPDEQVERGTDVISLGGSSVAALGNARNRLPTPALSVLTSLLVGRYTLINFIDALESLDLSEVQAAPTLTVMDNKAARVLVGERTPLRVIDLGSQAGGGGGGQGGNIPQATVQLQETGIKLDVTPHVTAGNNILLDLRAERSAAELAQSDAGFIFRTQEAESRVLVEDGETVVIAGLTISERTESRSGIPLLMSLPVVGRLFRVTREQEIQRDLIILVTPQIVRTDG